MAEYFVYALCSSQRNYIYVGMTTNVLRRYAEHNKGYERTTRPYKPFYLLYSEEHARRVDARKREKYFKSGAGKEYLQRLRSSYGWDI
ncbi:MAG: GIY-YIG nuclease family protein [Bacteroidota bacterium]